MSFMMCVVAVIWSSAILAGLMPLVGWNKYIYEVCIMVNREGLKTKQCYDFWGKKDILNTK